MLADYDDFFIFAIFEFFNIPDQRTQRNIVAAEIECVKFKLLSYINYDQ